MVAQRSKCSLPDPPFEPPVPEQEEEPEEKKAPPAKGAKGKQEEVEEVELSPEEAAANKMFEEYCDKFCGLLEGMKNDLLEYKKLNDPVFGVKKVGLWPKKYSQRELAMIQAQEKAAVQKEIEAEEAKAKETEEAKAPPGKQAKQVSKPGTKPDTR